jgi:hypothetical protein
VRATVDRSDSRILEMRNAELNELVTRTAAHYEVYIGVSAADCPEVRAVNDGDTVTRGTWSFTEGHSTRSPCWKRWAICRTSASCSSGVVVLCDPFVEDEHVAELAIPRGTFLSSTVATVNVMVVVVITASFGLRQICNLRTEEQAPTMRGFRDLVGVNPLHSRYPPARGDDVVGHGKAGPP